MSDDEMEAYRKWYEDEVLPTGASTEAAEGGDRISSGAGPIPVAVSTKGV